MSRGTFLKVFVPSLVNLQKVDTISYYISFFGDSLRVSFSILHTLVFHRPYFLKHTAPLSKNFQRRPDNSIQLCDAACDLFVVVTRVSKFNGTIIDFSVKDQTCFQTTQQKAQIVLPSPRRPSFLNITSCALDPKR